MRASLKALYPSSYLQGDKRMNYDRRNEVNFYKKTINYLRNNTGYYSGEFGSDILF